MAWPGFECHYNTSIAYLRNISDPLQKTDIVMFECDCPLGPEPYPEHLRLVLPNNNWSSHFHQHNLLTRNITVTDWCWPGTHDSLSCYYLFLQVSQDKLDDYQQLSKLLHTLMRENTTLTGDISDFFRIQAKTQQLTITQQLDDGIQFIEFWIMLEQQQTDTNNNNITDGVK
jgi:hypothetical protein